MPEKVIDRIERILSHYKLSNRAFDLSIGKSNGYIGKQIERKASIGSDALETILNVYNDISPQWLIAGEGEMLRKKTSESDVFHLQDEQSEYQKPDYFEDTILKYLEKDRVQKQINKLIDERLKCLGYGEKEKTN